MFPARCLRNCGCVAILLGVVSGRAPAAISFPELGATRSVSGQFVVTSSGTSRLSLLPAIATNADFVRLEPALLTVSAERIRESLHRTLHPDFRVLDPLPAPRGKIYLVLHPAQSPDETVTIVSRRSAGGWDYQVQLPDVLPRIRYVRALTSVLLLQSANRDNGAHSAEIPAWLIDGLSQDLLAVEGPTVILTSPSPLINGQPGSRMLARVEGLDPLADARRILRDHAPLTFAQLSWPTEAQLAGADGGVYHASAQLFFESLLKIKDGPAHLRAMLASLSEFYNWQTAFQAAFRSNFARPLDVEKWWAVQTVSFLSRDAGPTWSPPVSREKLDEILSVAVEMRMASNALPVYAEISFQAVLRNYDRSRQAAILQPRVRDLELAQFRMAPAYAVLADGYRTALTDYLNPDQRPRAVRYLGKHLHLISPRPTVADTLKKLDALDARRRSVESAKPADNEKR